MARRYWPSQSAIGKRFKEMLPGLDGRWMVVVGVVKDVIYNRDGVVIPVFYGPARQWPFAERQLVIRTELEPRKLAAAVRETVEGVDRTLPRLEITAVEDELAKQDRPRRFQTELIGTFAGLALILAATGLYGLMAY